MSTRLLVLSCLLLTVAASAYGATTQMWVWVDAKGVTHYSDRPVPGAKLISIATMEPEAAAKPAAPRPTADIFHHDGACAAASTEQYQLLEIFQPAENETFFNADAVVTVRIRSEPELVTGDRMRLYLDGNLVEGDPTALEYTLPGLERGAHSLRAQIVDAQGKPKDTQRATHDPHAANHRERTARGRAEPAAAAAAVQAHAEAGQRQITPARRPRRGDGE